MWTSNCSLLKVCLLSAGLLAAAVFVSPIEAQQGPPVRVGATTITGFPEDWSHRHVVFSKVETEDEARAKGEYDNWQKIVNNPRYVIQQLKSQRQVQGPAGTDADYRSNWFKPTGFGKKPTPSAQPDVHRDWSEALGGPGLAAGHFPAKYGLSTTTTTCGDFAVFPTGATGASTQATIMAFNSLYSGCPAYSSGPVTYWAYNTGTGSKATTSPVISPDGTQIAFVQVNGTAASLGLLKMAASGGTAGSPVTPTSESSANYHGCSAPCYTTFSLGANDTNSAPFYVYGGPDILYVGDDAGNMHKITGAFSSTPAIDPTNWPVTAISTTTETTAAERLLYSPVLDSGASGLIFVTSSGGYLHSINPASPTTAEKISGRLENNTTNQFDSPVVDSTNEYVYVFVGYEGVARVTQSYVNRFAAGTALAAGNFGTGLAFPNTTTTTGNATGSRMFAGAFDNNYYNTYTSGHLYACEDGVLYQVDTTAAFTTTPVVYNKLASTVGTATQTCSPVTEFLGVRAATTLSATIAGTGATTVNVASGTGIANNDYIQVESEIMKVTAGGGTTALTVTAANRGLDGTTKVAHTTLNVPVQDVQDWLFTSVEATGNATGCTGACIYNYNVITEAASGTATAGLAAAGGTSGIVIDSSSMAISGDAEIYYTLLGGTSAIQVSQAGLQ